MRENYGVVTVSYNGRVVIPAKLRSLMGIDQVGTLFNVYAEGDTITLVKHADSCVICGTKNEKFKKHNGKLICLACCSALL